VRDDGETPAWTVVLPVKHGEQAKSRLTTPPAVDRLALARAIALDSLAAVLACEPVVRLVVVTSDPVVGDAVSGPQGAVRVDVVPDPGAGLPSAIRAGLQAAGQLPAGHGVGVLLPDVPALRPDDLAVALGASARHRVAYVPDLEGTGTVLLTGTGHAELNPAFGPRSAARHEAGGAVRLELDLPRLRRDVDTWEALQQALGLGAGPATTAAAAGS
jgi:2-phospho-L-lactate guanylyltransferase